MQEAAAGYEKPCAGDHDNILARYELYPLGEQAVVIRWDGEISEAMLEVVAATVRCLEQDICQAVVEFVRAYRTVTVYYDPVDMYLNGSTYIHKGRAFSLLSGVQVRSMEGMATKELREEDSPYAMICSWIRGRLKGLQNSLRFRNAVEHLEMRIVPVCFDLEFGPDLSELASKAKLSVQEVVGLICSATYLVHMVGFTNGFPYMGGFPDCLAMPRRSQPRLLVPEGTVAVAGTQAGIYPIASPGGWQQIGRTPLNLLVGNERGMAALEMTLTGATLEFREDALVALCGAAMDARAEDGPPLPGWRPVLVRSGTVLRLGRALRGARACLAVAGGIAVPAVLGSRSTHVPSRLGGFAGRALQPGDRLQAGAPTAAALALEARLAAAAPGTPIAPAAWAIAPSARPPYAEQPVVRVTRGREAEAMTGESLHHFLTTPYSVTLQSDRMGYRLEGERLEETEPQEMISEAVTIGTVQVPPGGQPIVLMADAQTTGGYPRIAQVAAVDLPLLAQLKPGGAVRFREISLQEAQALYVQQQLLLKQLEKMVRIRSAESR